MIEGIKLSMTSTELKQLCEKRVTYHLGRAEWYQQKLAELEPALKEAAQDAADDSFDQLKYGNSGSRTDRGDPVERFKNGVAHHRDRATVFRFMAEHVITNETYVLTEGDLQKLEVLPPRAW